jgi:hypothetical protein
VRAIDDDRHVQGTGEGDVGTPTLSISANFEALWRDEGRVRNFGTRVLNRIGSRIVRAPPYC